MNELMVCLVVTLLSGLVVFLAEGPLRKLLLRSGIVDHPNKRSSHEVPTARGGGVVILAVIGSGSMWLGWHMESQVTYYLALLSLLLTLVSWVDDVKGLSAKLRLGCHVAAGVCGALAIGAASLQMDFGGGLSWQPPAMLGFSLAVFYLVGFTNAFNFMDGIDGLAAGQAALTAASAGLLSGLATHSWGEAPVLFSFLVAGSCAGFIPHNFPQARIFMGDVGSVPVGFLLACLSIWTAQQSQWWLLIPLVMLQANFILDTFLTFVRRVVRGERWNEAHHEHFYQRLVRAGMSHTVVTLWEIGLQTVVVLLMIAYLHVGAEARVGLIGSVIVLWLAFFCYCEFQFRRFSRGEIGNACEKLRREA